MDTTIGKYIIINVRGDNWIRFDENILGLYAHNMRDRLVKFDFNNKYTFTLYSFD